MVRLKEWESPNPSTFNVFQFHYGTIKSPVGLASAAAANSYFNSTMVRLKVDKAALMLALSYDFNSTMVRLKDEKGYIFVTLTIKFQFHYGTIKRALQRWKEVALAAFQFHYGTIKSADHGDDTFTYLSFQFHYGTIKRKIQVHLHSVNDNFNSTMVRLKGSKIGSR